MKVKGTRLVPEFGNADCDGCLYFGGDLDDELCPSDGQGDIQRPCMKEGSIYIWANSHAYEQYVVARTKHRLTGERG